MPICWKIKNSPNHLEVIFLQCMGLGCTHVVQGGTMLEHGAIQFYIDGYLVDEDLLKSISFIKQIIIRKISSRK